jgi:hypothetical protein
MKPRSVALATLSALVLLVATAEAAAPPVSCQSDAPHHTQTYGANTDAVTFTSTHQYWNNDCGCYIAQIEVPSTCTPTDNSKWLTSFKFGAGPAGSLPDDKAECESYKARVFVYLRENDKWTLKYGGQTTANWVPNPGFPGIKCQMSSNYTATAFSPPSSGTAKYRILTSVESNGKNKAVKVDAGRIPNIH